MKTDLLFRLYMKYSFLTNKEVEITLRNHEVVKGVLAGYFKANNDDQTIITKWHISDTDDKTALATDVFGYPVGKVVLQKDILKIIFKEDNSIMQF